MSSAITEATKELRIVVDQATDLEINKFQARRVAKSGKPYLKMDAAADYFMELVKKDSSRD